MSVIRILVVVLLTSLPSEACAETPIVVQSPDGRVRIECHLRPSDSKDAVPHYRVLFRNQEVVGFSRLGIDFDGGGNIGGPCVIENVETRIRRESYGQFPGKRREVTDHCSEAIIKLKEKTTPGRHWELVFRAYDDGVAFRYRIPAQNDWHNVAIVAERTEFSIAAESRAFALPLNSFTTSYEKRYEVKTVGGLPKNWLIGLPLLLECRGGVWAALTEANVTDYAGLYLTHADSGNLVASLSPLPKEPSVVVRTSVPAVSPWRVVMVGDRVGRLIESDIVLNLSDPCAIKDPSWIKTGKTTFPWWNGYYEENVSFRPGLNNATVKHYIDFCAEAGIPYHSLDGVGNSAWYGGPIVPYQGADPTQAIAGLDLPDVLNHAKSKNVRLRVWMHWRAAEAHIDRAFPLYQKWGIEGVMIDFMDRDDQEMVAFVRRVVKTAADNRLTVTLHGCPKPTGLERTFPNLLTSEGVLNLEYNKWDKLGCPPEHELMVPFTRMLAGPLDFHQGSFRAVRPDAFAPRNDAPFVMGTACRTLASYVVYQNHLPMVADYPTAYRGHPALAMLAKVPTAWDDTRVLDAKVGEYVVIGRRSGADWYVGAMTDRSQRSLSIPLTILGAGDYVADVFVDDDSAKYGLSIRQETVTAATVKNVTLAKAGGCFMRIALKGGTGDKHPQHP